MCLRQSTCRTPASEVAPCSSADGSACRRRGAALPGRRQHLRARRPGREVEDGVLWTPTPEGVIAATRGRRRIAGRARRHPRRRRPARRSTAGRSSRIDEVIDAASRGVERHGAELHGRPADVAAARDDPPDRARAGPVGPRGLYFVLAAVGIFSLLVGASVRLRRPDNQATLHFFWLTVAFFGVLAFSFSGRLDTLDWAFYWGDVVGAAAAAAAVRALRAGVSGAPRQLGAQRRRAARCCRCCTCRRCCSAARAWRRSCAAGDHGAVLSSVLTLDRARRAAVSRGQPRRRPGDHGARARARALGDRAPAAALDRLGHGARRAAVRVRLRAAVRARAHAAARLRAERRCCSGSCRWPSRPRSSATG